MTGSSAASENRGERITDAAGLVPRPGLAAEIGLERPGFRLDVAFEVEPGSVTAIVGANGAGKSTTLRSLAGLTRPQRSRISVGGRVVDDTERGVRLPVARRGIGVVFQDYLLFPHLSVVENVAFGLRARGIRRADATASARRTLELLGIPHLADVRPGSLSGGQAQRVALARALAIEPELLLLDEPLAALDATTRIDVRTELARHVRGFEGATVLVTHDAVDALALADRILVLDRGTVAQHGTTVEVSERPATPWVASLMGLNLLRGPNGPIVFAPEAAIVSIGGPGPASTAITRKCVIRGVEEFGGRVRLVLSAVAHDGLDERLLADVSASEYARIAARRDPEVWVSANPRR